MNRSTIIIAACTLLIGLLIGAASASIYERQKASRTLDWMHAEIAITCRTHPEIQAGRRSLCNLFPVSKHMALLAKRTGRPTIDLSAARQVEDAAREDRMRAVQEKIDAMNAEREAFVAECMAETIKQIDEINSDSPLADISLNLTVGNQHKNACERKYSMMQQDRQLREEYTSSE